MFKRLEGQSRDGQGISRTGKCDGGIRCCSSYLVAALAEVESQKYQTSKLEKTQVGMAESEKAFITEFGRDVPSPRRIGPSFAAEPGMGTGVKSLEVLGFDASRSNELRHGAKDYSMRLVLFTAFCSTHFDQTSRVGSTRRSLPPRLGCLGSWYDRWQSFCDEVSEPSELFNTAKIRTYEVDEMRAMAPSVSRAAEGIIADGEVSTNWRQAQKTD